MVKIFVDDREYFTDKEFLTKRLLIGDYTAEHLDAVVEHKTPRDFEKSCTTGHLVNQVIKMNNTYKKSVVVVSGIPNFSNQILGRLARLIASSNTSFVFLKSKGNAFYFIKKFFEKVEDEKPLTPEVQLFSTEDMRRAALCCIPSIGWTLAERLLEKFKTMRAIASASLKELTKVRGIGKEKAVKVVEFFSYEKGRD